MAPPGPGILFPTEAWPLPSAEKAARRLLHLPFHFFYLFRSALSLTKWSAPQGRALTSAGAPTPFGSLRHLDFPSAVAVIGADEGIRPRGPRRPSKHCFCGERSRSSPTNVLWSLGGGFTHQQTPHALCALWFERGVLGWRSPSPGPGAALTGLVGQQSCGRGRAGGDQRALGLTDQGAEGPTCVLMALGRGPPHGAPDTGSTRLSLQPHSILSFPHLSKGDKPDR